MKVELHIEELVLEGFDPRDRHRMRDAVERELARLLGEGSRPAARRFTRDAEVPELQASFAVPVGSTLDQTGAQVARAVHETVGQASATPISRKGRAKA
jgi:hypothetical protein